jgi:hypothetical protein
MSGGLQFMTGILFIQLLNQEDTICFHERLCQVLFLVLGTDDRFLQHKIFYLAWLRQIHCLLLPVPHYNFEKDEQGK